MSAQLAQALRRIAEFNYSGAETPSVIARQALAAHEAAPQQAQTPLLKAAYVALDALDHYQHGGSEYRKIAAAAYERLSTALAAFEAAPQQEPAIIVTIDDLDLVQDWAESRLPPGTHKLYAAPQQAQAPKVAVCDFVQVDDSSKSSRSQHDADSAELRSLCAERDELRRWKSTYAPRIAALEGSLQHAQREAAQGMEARSALASEREANAILTDELEAQQAQAPGWQPIETAPKDMGTYLFLSNGVAVQGFRDATGELCVCLEAGAAGNPPWRRMRVKPTHWAHRLAAPQQGSNT